MQPPELRQLGVFKGLITPEVFAENGNKLPFVTFAEIPERLLGMHLAITILAYWHGADGPWHLATSAHEEHMFGAQSPEGSIEAPLEHTFTPENPDFAALIPVELLIRTYGEFAISASCNGDVVGTMRFGIKPDASELADRR